VDGDPGHEQQRPGDAANGRTVMTSEEKQHEEIPSSKLLGWMLISRG
jgi:hypothetical protein